MKTTRIYSASELEQWKESGMGLLTFILHSGIPLTSLRDWLFGSSEKNKPVVVHLAFDQGNIASPEIKRIRKIEGILPLVVFMLQ